MSAEPDLPPQGEHGPNGTERDSRAARHERPSSRMTPSSLLWQLTKAPRPRLTDPNHDPIRSGLLTLIGILMGFGLAAHDLSTGGAWWVLLRGLAVVAGAFLLIWLTIAYLGRPPTASKPSLVSKIRDRRHDRNQERQADR